MRSKISDVAKMAGVSKSTVSNYINNRYEQMSEETRQEIAKAIQLLDYTPNISARRLSAKQRCQVICVIIPINIANQFDSLYYPTVLTSVGKAAAENDYNILVFTRSRADNDKNLDYLKSMIGTIADGFIIFDLKNDDYSYKEFERMNIPYVCVGKIHDYSNYKYVASDHAKGVSDAVDHLVGLGHTRIATINEGVESVVTRVRQFSFLEASKKHGLPLNDGYHAIITSDTPIDTPHNLKEVARIFDCSERPTAVITSIFGLPILEKMIEDKGLTVPEDISIIVLDYKEIYSGSPSPKNYTRVNSIADKVSRVAFEKLLYYIENEQKGFNSQLLPVTLIEGASTAPLTE